MKRLGLLVCALSVVLLISSAAMAQQPEGRQGRGRPGQGRPGQGRRGEGGPGAGGPGRFLPPILQAIDADGDGVISKEEIAGAVAALKKLDENGDGQLTREEYMGRGPAGPGRGGPGGRAGAGGNFAQQFLARLKEADANGDGKISKEEAPERMRQGGAFDRIDTNSDGLLDEAELKALAERIGRGRAGRGGDGARGGAGRRGGRPDGDDN